MIGKTIVRSFGLMHTIRGLVGYRVERGSSFLRLLEKDSHLKDRNMLSNKKDALLASLVRYHQTTMMDNHSHIDSFSKEFCRLNNIKPESFSELSNKLQFFIVDLEDGGHWFCQTFINIDVGTPYDIPKKSSKKDKDFKGGDSPNECTLSSLFHLAGNTMIDKNKILKEFCEVHKLGINFTEDDISKLILFHPGHESSVEIKTPNPDDPNKYDIEIKKSYSLF
ncbi:hypothetical protein ACTFIU_004760 [Dictyostelium citrinum]